MTHAMRDATTIDLKNRHGEITQCVGDFNRFGPFSVVYQDSSENVVLEGPMNGVSPEKDNRLPSNWADVVNWSRSFGYSQTVRITNLPQPVSS